MAFLLGSILVCRASFHQNIEYGRADGISLKLDAHIPEGKGPFPAVILVHGGAWVRGDKNGGNPGGAPGKGLMVPMHEPLEKAGFAWFSINYRLADKHPFPACIEDLETAIRWVKANAKRFNIDPERLALSGESAGAHLVAMAAVRANDETRVAAVVPFYGPFNMAPKLKLGTVLNPTLSGLFGAKIYDEKTAKLAKACSPLQLVKPDMPPFLLLHGTGDTRVSIRESFDFQKALQDAGVSCDFIQVPDGAHGMKNWDTHYPQYKQQVIDWLKKKIAAPESAAK